MITYCNPHAPDGPGGFLEEKKVEFVISGYAPPGPWPDAPLTVSSGSETTQNICPAQTALKTRRT